MLRVKEDSPQKEDGSSSNVFLGVRFLLLGFNPIEQAKVRSKLVTGGGVDVGEYGPRCTHLVVDRIVYDDSECVVARADGKTVVTALWVEHCLDVGMLVDASSVLYRPLKDLNGIPGANSLSICLTGYQRQDRDDIMRMVGLMGAYFSKPLVANKVTHLICYKFEGEKYDLAKKLKKIKLVNHRWLEDCLRAWDILPECNYTKSGYELEIMEAEAKDSEEETEDTNNKPYMQNVAHSPSHLHNRSGPRISKALEMSTAVNRDEASEKILSSRTDVDDEKRLASIPRKHAESDDIPELPETIRKGEEFTGEVSGAYTKVDIFKESSELSYHPGSLSYSRKTPGRSQVSKLAGKFSSHCDGSPSEGLERDTVKNDFDASPAKQEHLKRDLDLEQHQNACNDSKLHLEGGISHNLPQKGKGFLSNATSRSQKTVSAKSKVCGSVSPAAGAKTEGLLTSRSHIKSSSCQSRGDNLLDKNCVQSPASNQSANLCKTKSSDVDINSSNHGMPVSRSTLGDCTEIPAYFKMLERTPEKSGAGVEACKFASEANSSEKEMQRSTLFQFDRKVDPGEDRNFMISSPKSGNCEGRKIETSSSSLTKMKLVNKSLGSKPKISSGSNTRKRSFSTEKDILDGCTFSTEKVKEAEDGKRIGVHVENFIENKAAGDSDTDNKVENAAAAEDDETEAPDEGIGVELANPAREETTNLIPLEIKNKLKDLQGSAIKIGSGVNEENLAVNFEEDKQEVVEKDKSRDSEVARSIVNGEAVKRRKLVSNKNKKGASASNKMEKSENDKEEELNKINDDEQTPVKRRKTVSNKNKKGASALNETERSENDKEELKKIVDDERTPVKESCRTQCPVTELQCKLVTSEKMENPKKEKNDDMPVENEGPMRGRKYISSKGKKNPKPNLTKSETKGKKVELDKGTGDGKTKKNLKLNINRSETTGKGEKVEPEKGTNDGETEVEVEKEVQHPVSRAKDKTVSMKKAQKHMCAEKENEPIESAPLGANQGRHKRKTGSTKLHRTPTQISDTVYGTNVDGRPSGGSSKSITSEPARFILSGHRLQRKEFQQIIKRLKGRVCRDSHSWSYQATHFIVPDPIRRTEKFFAAAASGRWILKTDYLTASNQSGKLLPEESYEWFKNGFSEDGAINLEAPRKWRLLRERTGHGAFHGMRIIVYGECIAPSLDTLKRVVKGGDGVILATSPPYTRFLKSAVDFAVVSPGIPCGDSWVQEFLRHEIPCVAADYLVEYVCKPGSSLERHVLYKTHTWADKSVANLLKRSEEIVEDLRSEEEGDDDGKVEDISCQVCSSHGRADIMLVCGDESGSLGCGSRRHIGCCDPPLEAVPGGDWFCPKCSKKGCSSRPQKKKGGSSLVNSKRR